MARPSRYIYIVTEDYWEDPTCVMYAGLTKYKAKEWIDENFPSRNDKLMLRYYRSKDGSGEVTELEYSDL